MSYSTPDSVDVKFLISESNLLLRIGVMELFLGVLYFYSFRPSKTLVSSILPLHRKTIAHQLCIDVPAVARWTAETWVLTNATEMRFTMEILNVDTSFNFLQNKQLMQVCVGENEILLRFDDQITTTIEVPISHTQSGDSVNKIENFRTDQCTLTQLLGSKLSSATLTEGQCLTLAFSNGDKLSFQSDGSGNECFQISTADETYISY